jgi:hypothetical protein
MGNNKNRVRGVAPKYTTGLGDGHVEDTTTSKSNTDDEAIVQKVIKARWHHPHLFLHQKLRNHQDPEDVTVMFPKDNNDKNTRYTGSTGSNILDQQIPVHRIHNTNIRRNGRGNNRLNDPWDTPVLYLVAATVIVIVSAVVVHLIVIGNEQQHASSISKHQKELKRKYSRLKKKIDEWNEDANDEELKSESVRGSITSEISDEQTVVDETAVAGQPFQSPMYQHRLQQQQQNRHRKNSSSSNTVGTSTTSTVVNTNATTLNQQPQIPAPYQQQLVQQQCAHAANNNIANRSYYPDQPGSAVSAVNIFNNQSNNGSIMGNSNTSMPKNSMVLPQRGDESSPLIGHRTSQLGYCPPSPIPRIPMTKQPPALDTQVVHEQEQNDINPSVFQGPSLESKGSSSILHARQLSTSRSSFESLLETNSFDQDENDVGYAISCKTPQNNSQRSLFQNTDETIVFPIAPAIREPDALTPKMGLPNKAFNMSDLIEDTPRMINGGRQSRYPLHQPVPEHSPLNIECEHDNLPQFDRHSLMMPPPPPPLVSTSIDMTFATSPKLRERIKELDYANTNFRQTSMSTNNKITEQQQVTKQYNNSMPFVPMLSVDSQQYPQHRQPPQSVHLDQLHLYQLMESGNVSHWEERVAEESRQLQNRIFPNGVISDNIRDSVLAASKAHDLSTGSMSNTAIPSNDPRKGIHHKREDLTDFTDAASSLQGSIEFSEIKLIEVIGGGGFGQVWKASWRGTPVAVKVLTGSAQSKSVPLPVLEEFAAEINLLKGMRHPNICLYMGACLEPPNRAIITELAANGSLWDALRLPLQPPYIPCDGVSKKGWPDNLYAPDSRYGAPPSFSSQTTMPIPSKGTWHWVLVKRVAFGAARGLSYLHGGKIPVLHRDLKSANILLDESYTAKVCDFGLSRLKAQERSMTGNCGTVQWMVR